MPATGLIGRQRELAEVLKLLREKRLLTLTGPGGVGKTRLAQQAASEVVDEFPDGVWFVSLVALREPELVLPMIAETLGVREPQTLERHLRAKKLLLVLDNFEQLLDAAPQLAELRAQTPKSKLLVTSREALHLAGEQEYLVPPLSDEEATRLFVERAQAAKPSFRSDAHVSLICRNLDNLPLAIELAAARTKVLSPEALLARLTQRLPLLVGGARDLPEKQQTLRATIQWSYDLLREKEKNLFVKLAVFAGGFTLEAAEAICSADVDTLQTLLEKSLIWRSPDGRFFMLETLREFALDLLRETSDRKELRRGHARFYAELIRRPYEPLVVRSLEWRRLRDKVAPDVDNVRAAIEWALDAGEIELALEIIHEDDAVPVSYGEVEAWYDRALPRTEGITSETAAYAYDSAAAISLVVGDLVKAEGLCQRGLTFSRELGHIRAQARILSTLGRIFGHSGRTAEGRRCFEQALAIVEQNRLDDLQGWMLHQFGEFERDVGAAAHAIRLLKRGIEHSRGAGNLGLAGLSLHALGDVYLSQADLDTADARYAEGLRIARQLMDRQQVMYCLAGLAASAATSGAVGRAGRLWGAASVIEQQDECPLSPAERVRYERAFAVVAGPGFSAAVGDGEAMSFNVAVDFALGNAGGAHP